MFRHEPLTHAVLKLIAEGAIGPVTTISSAFTFELSRSADVRLVPALGGGSLWDVGCYAVNVIRLVAGSEPTEAFGWATAGPSGVDESFTGVLRFPTVAATLHSSFRSSYRSWLEIGGKTGIVRVRNPFRPGAAGVIEIHRDGEPERAVTVEGSSMLFLRLVEDFVAAALGDREPVVSLADSRGNAAALAALYASAQTGRPVAVGLAGAR
jgi:predicted dehydrogenase